MRKEIPGEFKSVVAGRSVTTILSYSFISGEALAGVLAGKPVAIFRGLSSNSDAIRAVAATLLFHFMRMGVRATVFIYEFRHHFRESGGRVVIKGELLLVLFPVDVSMSVESMRGSLYKPAKAGQGVLVEVGGLTVEAHISPVRMRTQFLLVGEQELLGL